jgi:uncharacterized protein YggU (UPF0235/DUF167 family)
MSLNCQIRSGSKQDKLVVLDGQIVIFLKAKLVDGEVNLALVKFLSKYLRLPQGFIKIKKVSIADIKFWKSKWIQVKPI